MYKDTEDKLNSILIKVYYLYNSVQGYCINILNILIIFAFNEFVYHLNHLEVLQKTKYLKHTNYLCLSLINLSLNHSEVLQ